MNKRKFSYGFKATTLEEAAPLVQRLLGVTFTPRSSYFYGGLYYKYSLDKLQEMTLYTNQDLDTGIWYNEKYRGYTVLLDVSGFDDMDEITRKLAQGGEGIELLHSY